MADDRLDTLEPKRFQPASETVTQRLERTGFVFDHQHFYQKLTQIKDQVLIDTSGSVFIPLLWGQPYVYEKDNPISNKNVVEMKYDPDHLLLFERFTFRRPVKDIRTVSGVSAYMYTSTPESLNMSDDDVLNRTQRTEKLDLMVAPEYRNILHQQGGTTVMTDETGLVRVSINCPYGLALPENSPVKGEADFPNIFDGSMITRIYLAAILRKMGHDNDLVVKATSLEPREVSPNEFSVAEQRIIYALLEIPSVRKKYFQDGNWIKSIETPSEPIDIFRAIMTSAQFDKDHNISFAITPN